jgi:RNA polymerase sigma factor (sigma-70 family)
LNTPELTDETLIQLCIDKDKKGQNDLYKRFVSPMGRLCVRYLKNTEDAREVVIEGFLKVFNNIKKFEYRGKDSLEVWIRKIMINECLMHLRKNRNLIFISISEEDSISTDSIEADLSAEEIFQVITSLPPGYRTIFNLYAIEGYSHKEISELLGITESASRSQLAHAREKLQKLLNKNGNGYAR